MAGANDRTYGQWWDWRGAYETLAIEPLRQLCEEAYVVAGASPDDAAFLVAGTLDKTVQGDHARGVVYVPATVNAARRGQQDLAAPISVRRNKPAAAVVDGGPLAAGRLVCRRGMQVAIEAAHEHGAAVVGARGAAGLLTQFVQMAIDEGMVGLVMTQTGPCVAPLGSYKAFLGNGPFAAGVPARRHEPVIVDMSFTHTSASGVILAAEQNEVLPPGMLLDAAGNPTTDPNDFREVNRGKSPTEAGGIGTLTALGNSHKGQAMLMLIGLLSSVLSDTSPPWDLAPGPNRGTAGSVLIAIDPRALGIDDLADRVDAFLDVIVNAPRRDGVAEILYPGLKSQQLRRERYQRGTVAVPAPQVAALRALAAEFATPAILAASERLHPT